MTTYEPSSPFLIPLTFPVRSTMQARHGFTPHFGQGRLRALRGLSGVYSQRFIPFGNGTM